MEGVAAHSVQALVRERATKRQIARALAPAGISIEFIAAPNEIPAHSREQSPRVLILDCHTSDDIASLMASLGLPPPAVVLLSQVSSGSVLSHLLRSSALNNLVAKHPVASAVHLSIDARELLVTCNKVLSRDIFGIEKYISGWGLLFHSHQVTSTMDKARVLDHFQTYLTALDCPAAVLQSIVNVADELIRNATVHAPQLRGEPRYEHLPSDAEVVLDPHEYVEVKYGCDGQRLMLSVVDHFGRLSQAVLAKCLLRGQEASVTPEAKPSGAGLGMGMVFRGVHQLVVNTEDGVRTEVIAGWNLQVSSAAEFRQVAKSIHFFRRIQL